jgi:predicted nucleic acid-binding protein
MGYLIDTNVLSEIRKGRRANAGVREWFAEANDHDLFVSVLTIGETRRGIEGIRHRDPVSATYLDKWFATVKARSTGRVLLVTPDIADRWGQLNVPDPLPVIDSLLAATELEYGLTLVTRIIRDVERTGASLLNPFSP